nr:helveticin J family class III bacteriocin [Lactobacillus gasseri]
VEAAVSPNRQYFLIASIDINHTGHFAVYNLDEVNKKLDEAEEKTEDINIQNLNCLGAFNVPHFNDQKIISIQGYGIDDNKNIYISSQPSPYTTFLGFPKQGKPREIVKIPWGISDPSKWSVVNLDNSLKLDALNFCTEFEGIQVTGDCLYLTVAYHQRNSDLTTLMNRIYQVEKF